MLQKPVTLQGFDVIPNITMVRCLSVDTQRMLPKSCANPEGDRTAPDPQAPSTTRRSLCMAATLALAGCASEPRQPPTRVLAVPPRLWDGETAGLAERIRAQIIMNLGRPGVVGVLDTVRWHRGLRPHAATTGPLTHPSGRPSPVWALSNPDEQGNVAVLTGDLQERRHAVQLLGADGSVRTLRSGPGDALWDRPISAMALSPCGSRLAMVAQPDPSARHKPLNLGMLQVLDLRGAPLEGGAAPLLAEVSSSDALARVLGQPPAWLHGRTKLLVAVPGSQGRASSRPLAPADQPDPEVHLVDLADFQVRRLVEGHSPIANGDGASFLFARGRNPRQAADTQGWVLVDPKNGQQRVIDAAQGAMTPVTVIAGRYLIFTAWPHPQSPVEHTVNNSPLVGPKRMRALKVMDLASMEVQTLLEGVDPRTRISAWGTAAQPVASGGNGPR